MPRSDRPPGYRGTIEHGCISIGSRRLPRTRAIRCFPKRAR